MSKDEQRQQIERAIDQARTSVDYVEVAASIIEDLNDEM
jgi:flavin-binding protein dodecin